jgi:protein-tyrosine phosphatase
MKFYIVVAIALIVLAPAGAAQSTSPDQELPLPRPRSARLPGRADPSTQRTPTPLLQALDANHDGVIDAEEIENASSALETLDKNGDGELTTDEYLQSVRPTGAGRRGLFNRRFAPAGPTVPQGGLENFGVVDDHILRGAQPSASGIQTLKDLGVSAVIDLTVPDRIGELEKAEVQANGLTYMNLPMDSLAAPAPQQVAAILSVITNTPGKVFVHCRAGKDRTGTIVACYRMTQCNWSNEEALSEANRFKMAAGAVAMKEFISTFGKSSSVSEK